MLLVSVITSWSVLPPVSSGVIALLLRGNVQPIEQPRYATPVLAARKTSLRQKFLTEKIPR
jgi:hypothetical protein